MLDAEPESGPQAVSARFWRSKLYMPRKQGGQPGLARRITIPVPPELSDRVDAAVHALAGETLKSLTLRALEREIDRLEEERGDDGVSNPFPPAGRPPPGRPRKAADGVAGARGDATPSAESSAEVERLMHVLEQGGHVEPLRAKQRSATTS